MPVVAHPPCARWCQLAGFVEHRWGHKRGDDDGCFEAALAAVRRFGGVLEHPAWTKAWEAFGLLKPNRGGGWSRSLYDDGWVCHVEQGRYGNPARKSTWLYAVGCTLPELRWGHSPPGYCSAVVSNCRNRLNRPVRLMSKRQRSETPTEFRDILIGMAESVGHRRNRDRPNTLTASHITHRRHPPTPDSRMARRNSPSASRRITGSCPRPRL